MPCAGVPPTTPCASASNLGCARCACPASSIPIAQQSHRLTDVCERYGVSLDRPHDALADAAATAEVLPHLLASHGITETEQLAPFYVS